MHRLNSRLQSRLVPAQRQDCSPNPLDYGVPLGSAVPRCGKFSPKFLDAPATRGHAVLRRGEFAGKLTEHAYAKTVYHKEIDGENWSGIQITTAAGVCGVLDLLFEGKIPQKGVVKMEDVDFEDFISNRFGQHYA